MISTLSEFDIISRYFNKPGLQADADQQRAIALGIGDDCALLTLPPGKQLAISMDVLVADVHFPASAPANLIAQRALAVNLSDLAAMGACPFAFTLGLCLPQVDTDWLELFSQGLSLSAQEFQCPLVGGDMSKGPLTISIQVHGHIDLDKAITRKCAQVGDLVYVSGCCGAAALALKMFNQQLPDLTPADEQRLNQAFYQPRPRIDLGLACSGLVSAGIDVSDGLLADLGHIAKQSGVGMLIEADAVPISTVVQALLDKHEGLACALSGGDDYELALTVSPLQASSLESVAKALDVPLSCIGRVVKGERVVCVDQDGMELPMQKAGYTHF